MIPLLTHPNASAGVDVGVIHQGSSAVEQQVHLHVGVTGALLERHRQSQGRVPLERHGQGVPRCHDNLTSDSRYIWFWFWFWYCLVAGTDGGGGGGGFPHGYICQRGRGTVKGSSGQ